MGHDYATQWAELCVVGDSILTEHDLMLTRRK